MHEEKNWPMAHNMLESSADGTQTDPSLHTCQASLTFQIHTVSALQGLWQEGRRDSTPFAAWLYSCSISSFLPNPSFCLFIRNPPQFPREGTHWSHSYIHPQRKRSEEREESGESTARASGSHY
jgi:hypothetical protein